jgi:hypothetical protein
MPNADSPAIIHLRDFIEEISNDPSRPDQGPALQIQITLNIPSVQPEEQSDDVDCSPIQTLIRFFTPAGRSHLYQPDTFIYAWGPFHMVHRQNDQPQMIINAHTVNW